MQSTKNILAILLIAILFPFLACNKGSSLPTLVPTAYVSTLTPLPTIDLTPEVPTRIPEPMATYPVNQDVDSLVRKVLGAKLNSFQFEQYTEYRDQPFPDGRVGYHLDLSVTFAADRSREEMLIIAYKLMSEMHYNFSENIMFVSASIRSDPDDIVCAFGLGIGYKSASQYLPANLPNDLDSWFAALDRSDYYGDLPGQTEALLAYGNDPRDVPSCNLSQWKG